MAKKKKPAANPARGFATTSIASKPKLEQKNEKDILPAALSKNAKDDSTQGRDANIEPASTETKEKELRELTPEELTQQLERNELQLLVENYGPKVRREVSRLDSKLRTDSKVLRAQAQHVSLRKWLPDELMNEILDIIKKERGDAGQTPKLQPTVQALSEEDLAFRCWILWEALVDFGISTEDVKKAIDEVVKRPPPTDSNSYVWGFRESLDFLALDLDEEALPKYDARKAIALLASEATSDKSTAGNTPMGSMEVTPETSPAPKARKQVHSTLDDIGDDGEDIGISDYDSDDEPDDLVAVYLTIKERLYRHRPELVEIQQPKVKKGKQQTPVKTLAQLKPNERRLDMKLKTIESDALFDKYEAEQRWSLRRIQLMQEAASARSLNAQAMNVERQNDSQSRNKPTREKEAASDSSSTTGNPEMDDDDILGDMFAVADGETIVASSSELDSNSAVKLRDMGKLSGLNPRRVLEDACRGRDSRASVSFKLVSPSTFVSRHSVTVNWSVNQERITMAVVPYISIQQRPSLKGSGFVSSMTFTMVEVANPDSKQSEAFVATAAMFYIMSTSSKDEKQYLKLSPNFRDLYLELVDYQKQQIDTADREKLKIIRDKISAHSQQQEDDGIVLSAAFRNRGVNSPRPGSSRRVSPSKTTPKSPSADRVQLWYGVQSSPRFQLMLPVRMSLPMYGFKDAALAAINQSQVIILCGETGCGKSTQLPSYVLEHELSKGRDCKIYCTQPRRISAVSLAQRVSEELGELPGDVGTARSLVGYAIRLESKISSRTRLVYATVGVVLRMLESSKSLDDITHLIIDEVHERSIDTDFLLIVLRALMIRRPELKVILMSATVDATRFSRYLNNAPIINVPGRTFPVQTRFLEDAIEMTGFNNADMRSFKHDDDAEGYGEADGGMSGIPKQLQGYSKATREALAQYDEYRIDFELIIRLMEQVATDPDYAPYSKATLVFLPGIAEIRELNDLLTGSPIFQKKCWVIPLHSTIASEEQQRAFQLPPPGVRKVVLATNIAETGITIPDVTCVIDTGKHKEMRYDERRQLSRLIQSFISRANAKQRRGRAGRVQEGLCFHLFTKYRHDEIMAEQQTPEMLRLSLQDLVMRVKICGLGQIEETLASALDPPLAKNVRRAIDALTEVGALTSGEELTTLGSQLAKLPLDANLGKLCLLSAIFGCLDVGLTISAILSSKSPFVTPFGDRQRADIARLAFAKGDSDLLTAHNAYTTWRRIYQTPNQSVHAFCKKNYLSHQNLCNIEDLKGQLLSSLADTGLVDLSKAQLPRPSRGRQQNFVQVPAHLDDNSTNEVFTSSVIAWSFYPKLLIKDGKGYRNIANSQQVSLHPTSVNKSNYDLKFMSYYSMMASSTGAKYYNALSTTAVADVPVMLMVGDVDWKIHAGLVVIDGNRMRFRVGNWKDAVVLKHVRQRLEELVEVRLKEPSKELGTKTRKWLEVWEAMCKSYVERSKA